MVRSQFRMGRAWTLVALVAASLVTAAPAVAHESPNHGTVKVHDSEDVDPDRRNDPHVSCEFWVEGFDMSEDEGTLEIKAIPPTANPPQQVLTDTWTASPNEPEDDDRTSTESEDGFHFLAGPYTLDPGHYKLYVYTESGHPGQEDHFAKTKTFWVNACPDEGEEPAQVPCPPNVTAVAQQDGDILVEWDAVEDADAYRIYRAVGEGDLQSYAQVDEGTLSFEDDDTQVGVTYRYMVTAVVDGVESDDCPVVEATAIPFFPSVTGLAIASIAAVGAYFGYARRK